MFAHRSDSVLRSSIVEDYRLQKMNGEVSRSYNYNNDNSNGGFL